MRKMNNQKKFFIKSLAILVQPVSLGLSLPAAQLIAQGGIYALADAIIGNDTPYPKLEDFLANCEKHVVSAVEDIINDYTVSSLPSERYFPAEETAGKITDCWCDSTPLQYSDQEKSQIKRVLAEYFIKVDEWKLAHPEILRQILDKYGNDINKLKDIQRHQRNQIEGLKGRLEEKIPKKEKGITDNKKYADSFTDTLFLHRNPDCPKVNLVNLFVLQKYKIIYAHNIDTLFNEDIDKISEKYNLQDFLMKVFEPNQKSGTSYKMLFIEGDAGCGKSSLVAWMNYHYMCKDDKIGKIFGTRPIVTIRLRDLDKEDIINKGDILSAIRKYMNLDSLDDLEKLYPNAVMILDGFDELCMLERVSSRHDQLLYNINRKDLKGFSFIITSRPKYINRSIDIPSAFISLNHFDEAQRLEWIDKYTSEEHCGQLIEKDIIDYILNIDDDSTSNICDTPMTLYMLSARKGLSLYLDNNWALYHHIFYESLSETEYNKMFPDVDRQYSHNVEKIRDILYQISEEIAFRMFKNENKGFYISSDDVNSIVSDLSKDIEILQDANIRIIAEHCYALCCYWKSNTDYGVVEFYHNNIRDFFMAEKICRELDSFAFDMEQSGKRDTDLLVNILCNMFSYNVLETRTLEFILLRTRYQVSHNIKCFAEYEYTNKLLTKVILSLSRDGIIKSNILNEQSLKNPVQRINNILICLTQVFRCFYDVLLKDKEVIPWLPESLYSNCILENNFKTIFSQVPVTLTTESMITPGSSGRFSGLQLNGCDLRYIGFQLSEMKNMNFHDSILTGCDFSQTSLNGSDFSNANAEYTSFKKAILNYCDFSDTNLRGATLPDGFTSMDQNEMIMHLQSLNIIGLKTKSLE